MNPSGVIMIVTPPAIAIWQRPKRSCSHATATAVSAEEHAVSIDMLGPFKLKQ